MIEMKDVYKQYSNGVMAANGFNVNIKQGEFVYVVGPSGAGKSTFIKMMYREEKPTKGDIVVNGINLAKLKNGRVPFLRRNVGVVFQDFKLLPKMNVYENVAFALEVIEEHPKNIKKRVMEVLDLVDSNTRQGCCRMNCPEGNSKGYRLHDQSSTPRNWSLPMSRPGTSIQRHLGIS